MCIFSFNSWQIFVTGHSSNNVFSYRQLPYTLFFCCSSICMTESLQWCEWKTKCLLFLIALWNQTFTSLTMALITVTHQQCSDNLLLKKRISKHSLPWFLPWMTVWRLYGRLRNSPLPPSLPSPPCFLSLLPSHSQWHSSTLTVCTVKHSGIYCQLEFPWWGVIILCLSHPLRW